MDETIREVVRHHWDQHLDACVGAAQSHRANYGKAAVFYLGVEGATQAGGRGRGALQGPLARANEQQESALRMAMQVVVPDLAKVLSAADAHESAFVLVYTVELDGKRVGGTLVTTKRPEDE